MSIVILTVSHLPAQPPYGQYLVYHERCEDYRGNPAGLTPGTYQGNIHTVGPLVIPFTPFEIQGWLSTRADTFILGEAVFRGDLHYDREPLLNNRQLCPLPPNLNNIRSCAGGNSWFDSHNGNYITWLKLLGERGIDVYQFRAGTAQRDSLIAHFGVPNWQHIFVNGEVLVEGVLAGTLFIGSSGNMYLIDNIRYEGSNPANGDFGAMNNYLGLFTERDFIIRDNERNGHRDGLGQAPDNLNRHSIVLTAGMCAPFGRMRIEHTNADWEGYQGPEPDFRGTVHLRGCLWTRYGCSLFNANHEGTGYYADFKYDDRLDNGHFMLGYAPSALRGEEGDVELLEQTAYAVWGDVSANSISGRNGSSISFTDNYTVQIRNRFSLVNSVNYNSRIDYPEWRVGHSPALISVQGGGGYIQAELQRMEVTAGVAFNFNGDHIRLEDCRFDDDVTLRGEDIQVYRSVFNAPLRLESWNDIRAERCISTYGIETAGNPRRMTIINNTICAPGKTGLYLGGFRDADIRNNLIAFSRVGIDNSLRDHPTLAYNLVYGCYQDDYRHCEPGEGSVNENPRFINWEAGDLHLDWHSPAIDAGDPQSPPDADGTRADIGALPFDHQLYAPVESPSSITLWSVYPNPFNDKINIQLQTSSSAEVKISVYNLLGRLVWQEELTSAPEGMIYSLEGARLGAPGLYFIELHAGNWGGWEKVVYLK